MEMIVLCFPESIIKIGLCESEEEAPLYEEELHYEVFFETAVYLQRIYEVDKIRLFGNKEYCTAIAEHLQKFIPAENLVIDVIEERFPPDDNEDDEDELIEENTEEVDD